MEIKKVLAIGAGTHKIVPHKYQISISFKTGVDPSPLLRSLGIEVYSDFILEDSFHLPQSKRYYLNLVFHDDYFVLIIGYNEKDKKKVQAMVLKYIKLPKPKKKAAKAKK